MLVTSVLLVSTSTLAQDRNVCSDYLKIKKEVKKSVQAILIDHAKEPVLKKHKILGKLQRCTNRNDFSGSEEGKRI